jgi:hypothetical protein
MEFQRPDISYNPLRVEEAETVERVVSEDQSTPEFEAKVVAEKLIKHLSLIQQYNDRLNAIDYLIDNARSLSGNMKYITDDDKIIESIKKLGGKDNSVDLKLFEQAVDMVINEYKKISLISLSGVRSQ